MNKIKEKSIKDLKYNIKYRILNSIFQRHIGRQCEIILNVPDMESIEKIKFYIYDVYNNENKNINNDVYAFRNMEQLYDLLDFYEIKLETDKEYAKEKINEIKKLYEMD